MAVTFLATSVVAVGGTAVLGARWTARAVAYQEAVRVAAGLLDSIAALPDPGVGTMVIDGFRVRWESVGALELRVVVSAREAGPDIVTLRGGVLPHIPVLPDEGDSLAIAPHEGSP